MKKAIAPREFALASEIAQKLGIGAEVAVNPLHDIDDPVEWIERYFYIPELRGPIQLQPYQKAVLRRAYSRDEDGHFNYSVVVWSDIKKSIKSCIAAAVILERARKLHWGSVHIVANDLKQANSRVKFYAERAVEMNPDLKKYVRPRGNSMYFPNRTRVEAIPIDPKGEAGGNDDLIVFSELWGANSQLAMKMWTEMTLSPTKWGISQRWVETYAGFSGESPTLEQLYHAGVTDGERLDLSYTDEDGIYYDLSDLEVFENRASSLLVLWNTQARCPWQTPEYYAAEAATLTPNEYARVHQNRWGSSTDAFVPMEWWDSCMGLVPQLDANEEIVVGVDAGISSDLFAIVSVSRVNEHTLVRGTKTWMPPKGGKIEFRNPSDPLDLETPAGYLRYICANFNVVKVVYDKYQLHDLMTELRRENISAFDEFEQGSRRLVADKHLYDIIRERKITHSNELQLREHIANANRHIPLAVNSTDKLRIVKRADALKIDLAVALSMAAHEAKRLNLG